MNLRKLSYIKPKIIQDKQATWKTRDRQILLICEMTNTHIINCIQMLTKSIIKFEKKILDYSIRFNNSVTALAYKSLQDDCEKYIKLFEHELAYREENNIILK